MTERITTAAAQPTIDERMPMLAHALDGNLVEQYLAQALAQAGSMRLLTLHTLRLQRHKIGRRCLIEYDVSVKHNGQHESLTLIGKIRAKGLDRTTYQLQQVVHAMGFATSTTNIVAVPEPLGVVPSLNMWLQRKVPGQRATDLFAERDSTRLAERIAEAVHRLHRLPFVLVRRHTMVDELRILHERLGQLAEIQPVWHARLTAVLRGCDQLAAQLPVPSLHTIHRDFYPDQVLVDAQRMYLIDLDMACTSDPALDLGNFIGHMHEYAIRKYHDYAALADPVAAMSARFCQLSGTAPQTLAIYAVLTLVRHIAISFQFPDRRQITPTLIAHCEDQIRRLTCL
jgi:aminoglycoside phosphotransferase (APT) family kinase protein